MLFNIGITEVSFYQILKHNKNNNIRNKLASCHFEHTHVQEMKAIYHIFMFTTFIWIYCIFKKKKTYPRNLKKSLGVRACDLTVTIT